RERRRGASRGVGDRRTAHGVVDRDMARGGAGYRAQHGIRRYPGPLGAVQALVGRVDRMSAAHAGAEEHPGARRVLEAKPRLLDRLRARVQRELREAVEERQLGLREPALGVEVDLAGDVGLELPREAGRDLANTGPAGEKVVEEGAAVVARRAHDSHAGDRDAVADHGARRPGRDPPGRRRPPPWRARPNRAVSTY